MEAGSSETKIPESCSSEIKVLFIEPFYGGSHKVLIDILASYFSKSRLVTLPAKKWHWRARCGALALFELIPKDINAKILFCSSVLSLAELLGMRPDLQGLKKVVYFHENQLVYPVQEIKSRDIQYAYNQITTCLAADWVVFNSKFNLTSFLDNTRKVIKHLPDFRPKNIKNLIQSKSSVIYFPMEFVELPLKTTQPCRDSILHIVWPHRWEFDKGPDDFFQVIFRLKENNFKFHLSILGESFTDNPPIFAKAKDYLKSEILNFGYLESKDEYYRVLDSANVVVSTAKHEFFGVSMIEATYCGCYPLVPNSLVYPEIYPNECLYSSADELYNRLRGFSICPDNILHERSKLNIDFEKYQSKRILEQFKEMFSTAL